MPTSGPSTDSTPSTRPPARKLTSNATLLQLQEALARLGLDQHGKKESLVRRFNGAIKKANGMQDSTSSTAGSSRRVQPMKAFLCFDVEATCIVDKKLSWPNEVIEFPVVLLKWADDPAFSPGSSSTQKFSTSQASGSGGGIGAIDVVKKDDSARTGTGAGPQKGSSLLDTINATLDEDEARNLGVKVGDSSDSPVPQLRVSSTFHTYVRPTWRKELSEFCIGLTGILQHQVDASPTFPAVMKLLEAWLDEHDLLDEQRTLVEGVCWVTDGPWDLRDFIPKQVFITPISAYPHGYPPYLLHPYLDLKKAFQTVFTEQWIRDRDSAARSSASGAQSQSTPTKSRSQITTTGAGASRGSSSSPRFYRTIAGQLELAGLGEFSGRQHSGIADATNVARVLADLARRDVVLEPTGSLPPASNPKRFPWQGDRPGQIVWDGPYQ